MKLFEVLCRVIKRQKGQGLVEYAFIIIFIAMALFVVLGLMGSSLVHFFNYFMSLF